MTDFVLQVIYDLMSNIFEVEKEEKFFKTNKTLQHMHRSECAFSIKPSIETAFSARIHAQTKLLSNAGRISCHTSQISISDIA